jgi:CubicO group peptidase (beta-lactamase class C family)
MISMTRAAVVSVLIGAGAAFGQPATTIPSKTPVAPSVEPAKPSAEELARYRAAAEYSAQSGGDVLLIYMDGVKVFERCEKGLSLDRAHLLASGSKSFWGIAAMAAVEDGLLTLDEKVADTITEWKSDPRKSQITIRHLLTLSSGLDPGANFLERPLIADNMKQALGVAAIAEPGTTFRYGPSHYYVFIEVLRRKLAAKGLEKSPEAYLQRRVLDPLGITLAGWTKDRAGTIDPAGGARAAANEWIKLGEFVQHQGRVAGAPDSKQFISWDLLKQVFESSHANPGYGLTWWLPSEMTAEQVADAAAGPLRRAKFFNRKAPGTPGATSPEEDPNVRKKAGGEVGGTSKEAVWMAAGLGGQRLYVIPGHHLAIVRLAHAEVAHLYSDNEFLHRLADPGAPPNAPPNSPQKQPGDMLGP